MRIENKAQLKLFIRYFKRVTNLMSWMLIFFTAQLSFSIDLNHFTTASAYVSLARKYWRCDRMFSRTSTTCLFLFHSFASHEKLLVGKLLKLFIRNVFFSCFNGWISLNQHVDYVLTVCKWMLAIRWWKFLFFFK